MPTERELKDAIDGKQLPAPTNGSQPQPAAPSSQAWSDTYRYSFHEINALAKTAAASGIFQSGADAHKAVIRIFYGLENGLSPMEALNDVYESKGRFYLYSDSIVSQLAKRGATVHVTHLDKTSCTAELHDDTGAHVGTATVTIADAGRMGLLDKPAWKSDPESMLFAKVVSRLNKRFGKRFWQTTVGVREDAEDVEWVERQTATTDAAGVAIASAGKRVRKRTESAESAEAGLVQDVEQVSEGESGEQDAGQTTSAPSSPETTVSGQKAAPKRSPSKPSAKKTPATKEQESQLIAALEEAGIAAEEWDEWAKDEFGLTDDNYQECFTVEVFNASMLWAQRAREEAEADAR